MAKYSLWNVLRNKKAIVVKMEKHVDPYSDWGRVKGVRHYIYQDGRLVEYRMAIKNHGHDKIAWTNVYNQQGALVTQEKPAEYSRMANVLLNVKYRIQRLFGRRNKEAVALANKLIEQRAEQAAKEREARIQELLRRNMEEYKERLAAAERAKRQQILRAALMADIYSRARAA